MSAAANSTFIASRPRPRPSTLREMVVEDGTQLPQEARKFVREGPMVAPPAQPLQRLIEDDGGQVPVKRLLLQWRSRRGLVLLEVRGPHDLLLFLGPLARGEAGQIEGARAQRRRFPVDHGDLLGDGAPSEHDVLSEQLSVDHMARQRAEPVDAWDVAPEAPLDEPAFPGVEVREDLPGALGAR